MKEIKLLMFSFFCLGIINASNASTSFLNSFQNKELPLLIDDISFAECVESYNNKNILPYFSINQVIRNELFEPVFKVDTNYAKFVPMAKYQLSERLYLVTYSMIESYSNSIYCYASLLDYNENCLSTITLSERNSDGDVNRLVFVTDNNKILFYSTDSISNSFKLTMYSEIDLDEKIIGYPQDCSFYGEKCSEAVTQLKNSMLIIRGIKSNDSKTILKSDSLNKKFRSLIELDKITNFKVGPTLMFSNGNSSYKFKSNFIASYELGNEDILIIYCSEIFFPNNETNYEYSFAKIDRDKGVVHKDYFARYNYSNKLLLSKEEGCVTINNNEISFCDSNGKVIKSFKF